MKKLLIPLAILVVIPTAFISVALGANWITTCQTSHTNHDDLVAFPGQPGAAHEHLYVGARTTNAFSTPDSLRAGGTTCGMAGDKSGYWIPRANYSLGTSKHALFYYSGSPNVRAFPPGLEMRVGNPRATSPVESLAIASGRIKWKCGPGSNTEYPQPPASCSSGVLVAVVEFPNWWNGTSLDSPDHLSHMSYRRDAAHPIELPRIKSYLRFAVPPSQPVNITFSSGQYFTFHVVFFNAWVVSELQRFIDQCMKTGRNCGTNPA